MHPIAQQVASLSRTIVARGADHLNSRDVLRLARSLCGPSLSWLAPRVAREAMASLRRSRRVASASAEVQS